MNQMTLLQPLVSASAMLLLLSCIAIGVYAQPRDYRTDDRLTKEVKIFLDALNAPGPALETLGKEDARNVLVDAQRSVEVDLSGITEAEKTITAGGYQIKLNIVRPLGVSRTLPVFIFIHGGGWILGDYPTHKRMVRDLVVLSQFAAVFVNYTRSPEAHYPQAINEIYAATNWVAKHGSEIGVDGSKLAIVGNSVGGNMTAATCLMAKEKDGPPIKLAIMMWPVTDATFSEPSYADFGQQRFLTTPLIKWMWDQYTTDLDKRKEIYASPLNATVDQLRGLPPTLIQVAENDVLRDEGEAYGRKLNEAGVNEVTVRYLGVIHDFGLLNGLATIPQTKALFIQAAAALKAYLK